MKNFSSFKTACCALALFSGTAAAADVTAADVWADWQESLALYAKGGLEIGNESQSGNTLTVSDVVLNMNDDTNAMTADIGDFVFVENGDGTVSITLDDNYSIAVAGADGNDLTVKITQDGLVMTASGTPDDLTYDFAANRYGLEITDIVENDAPVDADIRLMANNVSGTYRNQDGETRTVTQSLAADSLDILFDVTPPDDAGTVTISGKVNNVVLTGTGDMPEGFDASSPETMFTDGFRANGGYSYDSALYIFNVDMEGDTSSGTVNVGAGKQEFGVSGTGMNYDGESNDIAMSIASGSIPFPIDVSFAKLGFGLQVPLAKTEEPADLGLRINITDMQVNDMIWGMIDPSGQLPHDPITAVADVSGKAKLFYDMLDPTQAEAMAMADVPGELNALTLNMLQLKLAGALLTGSGDFTFDNTDLVTFDGVPRPEGEINLEITGANALIDKLVGMGLLPEDQAMMGRMMMGMFARTVGDDQLTSKIEINAEGHVLANGQRIQ